MNMEEFDQLLSENPLNQSIFDEYFANICEKNNDDENSKKVIYYRYQYISRFATSDIFWFGWIDSLSAPSSKFEIFSLAVEYFPSLSIAQRYCNYCVKILEEELMCEEEFRSVLQKLVDKFGDDSESRFLWETLITFEGDELEDLIEIRASYEDLLASKKRLVSICHLALSKPLNDLESLLSKISDILETCFHEKDFDIIQPHLIQKNFEVGIESRSARSTFEEYLTTDEFRSSTEIERLKTWRSYIEFEIKDKSYFRARRLYERSILDIPSNIDLWLEYVDFVAHPHHFPQDWNELKSVSTRCLRVAYGVVRVWIWKLLSLEALQASEDEVLLNWDQAFSCSFTSANDYVDLIKYRCHYCRRRIEKTLGKSESANELNSSHVFSLSMKLVDSLGKWEEFLWTYYPSWLEGWIEYLKYRLSLESTFLSSLVFQVAAVEVGPVCEKIETFELPRYDFADLFAKLLLTFPKEIELWEQYWHWSRDIQHDVELTRKLFHRCLHAGLKRLDRVVELWIEFEEKYGEIEDLRQAYSRKQSLLGSFSSGHGSSDSMAKEDLKSSGSNQSNDLSHAKRKRNDPKDEELPTTKKKMNVKNDISTVDTTVSQASVTGNETAKIAFYLRNLPFSTNVDEVTTYLRDFYRSVALQSPSNAGNPEESAHSASTTMDNSIELVTNNSQNDQPFDNGNVELPFSIEVPLSSSSSTLCKGFAILRMISNQSWDFLKALDGRDYHGRKLHLEIVMHNNKISDNSISHDESVMKNSNNSPSCPTLEENISPAQASSTEESSSTSSTSSTSSSSSVALHRQHFTVFVSKFSSSVTELDLQSMFSSCGAIHSLRLAVDKKTGKSKCNALIQFVDSEGKEKALKLNKSLEDAQGNHISVMPSKFAVPESKNQENGNGLSHSHSHSSTTTTVALTMKTPKACERNSSTAVEDEKKNLQEMKDVGNDITENIGAKGVEDGKETNPYLMNPSHQVQRKQKLMISPSKEIKTSASHIKSFLPRALKKA